jgi:hypothetical protein
MMSLDVRAEPDCDRQSQAKVSGVAAARLRALCSRPRASEPGRARQLTSTVIETAEFHCANDSAFIAKLREASVTNERGKHVGNQYTNGNQNNIMVSNSEPEKPDKPQQGTSRAYTLQRIAAIAPEMLARIDAGEISANAASPEALRSPVQPVRASRPSEFIPDQR